MRRTHLFFLTVYVFSSVAFAAARKNAPHEGYALLKGIKSPQELLFPHFPRNYCVPVTLSGPIAIEMRGALDSLKLDPPEYREHFDGRVFNLSMTNKNYSAQTRELLGGIMNPVELIDIVVESVVKYREGEAFAEITRDTRFRQDTTTINGRPGVVIRLTPQGDRFGYSYRDLGAFVHESWLTMLTITIDTSTHVIYELSTIRYSRMYDAGATTRPEAGIMNARYLFSYENKDGTLLPERCIVYFNAAEVLNVTAFYRQEGKYFVFEKKEICSAIDGKPSCLTVDYGAYHWGSCENASAQAQSRNKNYAKRIEGAAALSNEANEKLRIGRISESVRLLQKLVEQYGDTPQAVEARRLLGQLPKELQ